MAPRAASFDVCASDKDAPCGEVSAAECTDQTLAAWSRVEDDRDLQCIGRRLVEGCKLGDPRACGFAGRMALEGHGIARDVARGVRMLATACDQDVDEACSEAVAWLTPAEHAHEDSTFAGLRDQLEAEHACLAGLADDCHRAGQGFYDGVGGVIQNRVLGTREEERGCRLGNARACNYFGIALHYGDGLPRDVHRATLMFERACDLGEAIAGEGRSPRSGCANVGYMLERGLGIAKDLRRARKLYVDACNVGDAYGCFHADMMASRPPEDPARAVALWSRECQANDSRACAFLGILYEDGPDGFSRDEDKAAEAMKRACELGNGRACEWPSGPAQ
jgi:hypothetical protein